MKFLFWNTGRRVDNEIICDIITENNCEVAAFAEYNNNQLELLKQLNDKGLDYYHLPIIGCERINIFTKFDPASTVTLSESNYYTIRRIPHDKVGFLILVFVHFPSKLHTDEFDLLEESSYLKELIEKTEEIYECQNTLIIGDFNMNPFEPGMITANAFHAIPTKFEASRLERVVRGRTFTMFYNPMWNLFGDEVGPAGTYFYNSTTQYMINWNMFDQVIFRPGLIPHFDFNELRILTKSNETSLTKPNGRPSVSDHLPICFAL